MSILSNTPSSAQKAERHVKTYAIALALVLLAMYAATFFLFRFFEVRELRDQLQQAATIVNENAQAPDWQDKTQPYVLPEGVTVVRGDSANSADADDDILGLSERQINHKDYLVYKTSGPYLVAKSEEPLNHELRLLAAVLAALYAAVCMVIVAWWFMVRDAIKQLFEVR